MINQHNGMMLPKQCNLIFMSMLLVCMILHISTARSRVSWNILTAKHKHNATVRHYPKYISVDGVRLVVLILRNRMTSSLVQRNRILPGSKGRQKKKKHLKLSGSPFQPFLHNKAIKHSLCVADIIGGWKFASIPLRADNKMVLASAESHPGMNSSLWRLWHGLENRSL